MAKKYTLPPKSEQTCETCASSLNYNGTCASYAGRCSCGMWQPVIKTNQHVTKIKKKSNIT